MSAAFEVKTNDREIKDNIVRLCLSASENNFEIHFETPVIEFSFTTCFNYLKELKTRSTHTH